MNTKIALTAALLLAAASTQGCARRSTASGTTTTAANVAAQQGRSPGVSPSPASPTSGVDMEIPLPGGASLEGKASVTEIATFPEERLDARGRPEQRQEGVGGHAIDRTYRTDRSYADIVGFFDSALRSDGFTVEDHLDAGSSSTWRVRGPGGTLGQVSVKNTSPTTFDVITSQRAAVLTK